MIGAAIGGVLVHPAHNLHYVEGTYFWAGVMPMALIGIARAFEVDLTPYLTARGVNMFRGMQSTSIVNVLGQSPFWRLKWSDVVSPDYPTPESLPLFVTVANKLIMGTEGAPTIPLFIGACPPQSARRRAYRSMRWQHACSSQLWRPSVSHSSYRCQQ